MFTQKYQQNLKVISLVFALALMFLAEPALAKKAPNQKVMTNRNTFKSQPLKDNLTTAIVPRSRNPGRAVLDSVPAANSNRPETKVLPSEPPQKSNPRKALKSQPPCTGSVNSNFPEPDRAVNRSANEKHQPVAAPNKDNRRTNLRAAPRRTIIGNKELTVTSRHPTNIAITTPTRSRTGITQLSSTSRRIYTRALNSQVRSLQHPSYVSARHHSDKPFRYYTSRIYNRVVWPHYRDIVCYNYGPRFAFRYFYPHYHRKYIFVSLGGYWPIGCSYLRYYWYGCHPYYWYGCYPDACCVKGDTYNYYTYNYYGNDESAAAGPCQEAATDIRPVDANTFADVRAKLAAQAAEKPAPETSADHYFDEAVKAFGEGDYDTAVDRFATAAQQAPEDVVLPFAYVQALFAAGRYSEAVDIFRPALQNCRPTSKASFSPGASIPTTIRSLSRLTSLLKKPASTISMRTSSFC